MPGLVAAYAVGQCGFRGIRLVRGPSRKAAIQVFCAAFTALVAFPALVFRGAFSMSSSTIGLLLDAL